MLHISLVGVVVGVAILFLMTLKAPADGTEPGKHRTEKRMAAMGVLLALGGQALSYKTFAQRGDHFDRQFALEKLRHEEALKAEKGRTALSEHDQAVNNLKSESLVEQSAGAFRLTELAKKNPQYIEPAMEQLRRCIMRLALVTTAEPFGGLGPCEYSRKLFEESPELGAQQGELIVQVLKELSEIFSISEKKALIKMRKLDLRGLVWERPSLGCFDLGQSNLSRLNLYEASLAGAFLSRVSFHEANLHKADLSDAIMLNACLEGAFLPEAIFTGANLRGASLKGIENMDYADFTDAILIGADFLGANLAGANFAGADLRDAKNLTAKQVKESKWDNYTRFPETIKTELGDY